MPEQSGLRQFASRINLAGAVVLVVVKLAAWVVTGSVSLLAAHAR
jgi:divalent metal cation (Fe/Co/Zn/Cd) transporter